MHAVDGAPQRSHVQDMVETNPVVIRSTSKPDDMCWGDFRSPVHILRHAFS